MANDRREAVFARLIAICGEITGINKVYRNRDKISEGLRPAILIMDADETSDENTQQINGPSNAPVLVHMSPEIYILVAGTPNDDSNLGTTLNGFRTLVLSAIFSDSTMQGILGSNGRMLYDGCITQMARGRTLEGEMGLAITFRYPLKFSELT